MATRYRETRLKWWTENDPYLGRRYWSKGSRWYSTHIGTTKYNVHQPHDSFAWTATVPHNSQHEGEDPSEEFDTAYEARRWCDQQEDWRRWDIERRWSTGWRRIIKYTALVPLVLAVYLLIATVPPMVLSWLVNLIS